jgi:hypothetical protein
MRGATGRLERRRQLRVVFCDHGAMNFADPLPHGSRGRPPALEILDLIEPRPAPDAVSSYRDDEDRARARRWPAECIWQLRRA